ncbi:MAG: prepilin-type N-terminal cleavage/methylation domain-containing protein [Desulfobacteraceae bacterium]|nr:prepilin-type N-terminal cleavage/methylation domain-containing protein [Desulfobacteraceae bacterium]
MKHRKRHHQGFTLVELMVCLAVISIAAAIGVPSFLNQLPDLKLKGAARDLYSSMQKARLLAVKTNTRHSIVFTPGAPGSYQIINIGPDAVFGTADDSAVQAPMDLGAYGYGINYGCGSTTRNATSSGGKFPSDFISYRNNMVTFGSDGMLLNAGTVGYVYLTNVANTCFALGTPTTTGHVVLRRWYTASWQDTN